MAEWTAAGGVRAVEMYRKIEPQSLLGKDANAKGAGLNDEKLVVLLVRCTDLKPKIMEFHGKEFHGKEFRV